MRADAAASSNLPLERIVFRHARAAMGEWRCGASRAEFRDSGPIHQYLVAFPRTSVRIRHAGSMSFVADPTLFTLYNRGQRYTRDVVDPTGDHCDWWSVDRDLACEIAAALDARGNADSERPFRLAFGPAEAALYRFQRAACLRLRGQGSAIDPLDAEETAVGIVSLALASAVDADHGSAAPALPTRPAHRDVAQAALAFMGARFREPLTLAAIAAQAGVTPFHLCRVFRAQTGGGLHRHLTRLHLRASLDTVLARDADLSQIALDHGYSSHSHFTSAFVREFGLTPTAWRASVRRRRSGDGG